MKVPVIPAETNIAGASEETAVIVDGDRLVQIPWLFHILYATSFFGMYIFVLYVLEKRCEYFPVACVSLNSNFIINKAQRNFEI